MLKSLPMDSILFQLLSQGENHFVFVADLSTGQMQWSANTMGELGLSEERLQGRDCWEALISPQEQSQFFRGLQELEQGSSQQMQGNYHLLVASGSYARVRVQMWAHEENGQRYCVGVVFHLKQEDSLDLVTGLRGNWDFRQALDRLEKGDEHWGILVLGIDYFKRINDIHSYTFGDALLYTLAQRFSQVLPPQAQLYRLDGDSFGMLLPGMEAQGMQPYFTLFQEQAQQHLQIQGIDLNITLSGAACAYPRDGWRGDELLRCARIGLSAAQNGGGNQFVVYTRELSQKAQQEMLLLEKLRESISRGFEGFHLNYQPLILAESGKLYGCEVLLRWSHREFPQGVTPYEFIPILENNGLMPRVGAWVMEEALAQCAQWVEYMPDFQMSVNVTCEQFQDPEFRFFVMGCLAHHKLSPLLLTLELTESNRITDTVAVGEAFDFFRSQGIKIAFDDFGMGYASLDIFRVLSADELKIDRSFLERLTYDVTDQKIIGHLINLCHSMNMSVCVEGVESPEVINILQQLRPTLLQGYYYNKPLSVEAFENYYFLAQHQEKAPVEPVLPQSQSMVYRQLRPVQPMTTQELVDSAHAGIFQVGMDREFTFLTCNEGYRKMLGYTAKEVEEKFSSRALGFVHPDDMEYVNNEIRRQLGLGDTVCIEFRVVRADGTAIWIVGTGSVVRGKDGTASLSVVIINNDEQKRRMLKLERQHKFYKKVLNSVPTGLKCVRFDEYFTLDYMSPGFLSLLGYNESDLTTKFQNRFVNMVLPADVERLVEEVNRQVEVSNILTLRYRMPCKNGRIVWVETVTRLCPPDEDGIQRSYSNVVDITEAMEEQERARAQNLGSRYQEAAGQWGDVLFECNFQTNRLVFSSNFTDVFGRQPKGLLQEVVALVHPNDRWLFDQTLNRVRGGGLVSPIELRIRNQQGQYSWYSVQFNEPDYKNGIVVNALGKLRDIDAEKKERQRLLVQSQTDPLTGLLNKSTLEEKIRLELASGQVDRPAAIFMMDVDDFKIINDQQGHPYGDLVLREVAQRLRKVFGRDDLVGRAGGDEFMAFAYLDEGESPLHRGNQLLQRMMEPFGSQDNSVQISVSIGVACCPEDGTKFHDLFLRADSALYRAKKQGKNCCCSFSGA